MNRTAVYFLSFGILLGGTQHVFAQANTTFQVRSMTLQEPDNDNSTLTQQELDRTFFNLARCRCGERIRIKMTITPDLSNSTGQLLFAAGANCLDTADKFLTAECQTLESANVNKWNQTQEPVESVKTIMTKPNQECDAITTNTTNLTVYISADGSGTYQTASGDGANLRLGMDAILPPPPTKDADPVGGDGLATVYFNVASLGDSSSADGGTSSADGGSDDDDDSSSRDPDVDKTQILCEVLGPNDEWLAPNIKPDGASYVSAATLFADGGEDLCPEISDQAKENFSTEEVVISTGDVADGGIADGGPDVEITALRVKGGIQTLHPAYVCSDGVSATTGSLNISGLANGFTYRFWGISVDPAKNPSTRVALGEATPGPSEDFWERYKRSGGQAMGCSSAITLPGAAQQWGSVSLFFGTLMCAAATRKSRARHRRARRQATDRSRL